MAVILNGCGPSGSTISTGSNRARVSFDTCVANNTNMVDMDITQASAAKGGKLYDQWWDAAGVTAPADTIPVWSAIAADSPNTATGSGTWRCKECHGWDYQGTDGAYGDGSSHYTGIKGLFDVRNVNPVNIYCAITNGTDEQPDHAFLGDAMLSAQAILDLTKFITTIDNQTGIIDYTQYISLTTKQPIGADTATGQELFKEAGCGSLSCHGPNGNLHEEPLGEIADDNPWETMHKIRFGHPGATMPAFAILEGFLYTPGQAANIVQYLQDKLPGTGTGTTPLNGDVINGGKLYDTWWVAAKDKNPAAPTGAHPLFVLQKANNSNVPDPENPIDTNRCSYCHGWDYKGVDGINKLGSAKFTGTIGVLHSIDETAAHVRSTIKFSQQGDHDFGQFLSDAEIEDLVAFITSGVNYDTLHPISETSRRVISYNSSNGVYLYKDIPQGVYAGFCATCHGRFGEDTPPGGGPVSLSAVANGDPWETLHKIRFGQPGTVMPALYGSYSFDDAVDILGYIQVFATQ